MLDFENFLDTLSNLLSCFVNRRIRCEDPYFVEFVFEKARCVSWVSYGPNSNVL